MAEIKNTINRQRVITNAVVGAIVGDRFWDLFIKLWSWLKWWV